MFLNGAGGECVRLRNNAHGNTITDSVVQYCGMYGKGGDDNRTEYHNGEGIYIGTSPKSDDQPMYDNDESSDNTITNNVIRTFGSECLNVKENAHGNLFEGNVCSDNAESDEFDGSNVELRGHDNIVRGNVISRQRRLRREDPERRRAVRPGRERGGEQPHHRHRGRASEDQGRRTAGPDLRERPRRPDDELIETEDYTGDPTAPCPHRRLGPRPS